MGVQDAWARGAQLYSDLKSREASEAQLAKENAWRDETRQQEREQWARDAKQREGLEGVRKSTLDQIDADSKEQMFAPGGTLQYPTQPPGAKGVYAPSPIPGEAPLQRPMGDAAGPPEMRRTALQLPQGYAEQLNMNRAMANAAPNLESLASLQARQQKLKYFSQGRALGDYVRGAKEEDLDSFMQDINDSKRNGYSAVKGKNGTYTISSDGVAPIKMNREQLADWLSSQHVYKNTGDESALNRINGISANLASQVKDSFDRAKDTAAGGNQAFGAASLDAYHRGSLGIQQQELGLRKQALNKPEMIQMVDKATGEPVMIDSKKIGFDPSGRAVLPEGLAYMKQPQTLSQIEQEGLKAFYANGGPNLFKDNPAPAAQAAVLRSYGLRPEMFGVNDPTASTAQAMREKFGATPQDTPQRAGGLNVRRDPNIPQFSTFEPTRQATPGEIDTARSAVRTAELRLQQDRSAEAINAYNQAATNLTAIMHKGR